jgi:gluconokinase
VSARYVVGLDVGTSGARAALHDSTGAEVASSVHDYALETPHPGWAEQAPNTVWEAARDALADVARASAGRPIEAIGLSTIFHTLVASDAEGRALTPSIIWADTRAQPQVEELRRALDPRAIYQQTGCPLHPMYLPAKILWLKQERPDIFARVATFGSIKDYVIARLTGERVVDRSVATASGLYNLREGSWDETLVRFLGIRPDQLPPVVEPTAAVGTIRPEVAARTGLPPETKVVAGAGDGVLSSLGSGAVAPGQMTAMIGTSGAARLVADHPVLDPGPQARTWCYYLALGRWVAGAAINNGGLALRWVRENLLPGPTSPTDEFDFATLEADAAKAPPGSGGLLFLPFLTGERAPYWNANARGMIFGLAAHMGSSNVARSAFEGVCFRMRSIVEAVDEVAGPAREVRATGGFTRSAFWTQLLADVVERPLLLPRSPQASAFGAAGLAMIALGDRQDIDDVARLVITSGGPPPNPQTFSVYRKLYRLYFDVYWANQDAFAKVAALQEELG